MKTRTGLYGLLGLLTVLASPVLAQRPVPRTSAPRAVPRAGPTESARQHQARRDRLAREANARSDSGQSPSLVATPSSAPPVRRAAKLGKKALNRAKRDFALFELSGRRVHTERIIGELVTSTPSKKVSVVCLRQRAKDGSMSVVMRHSTDEADRPRYVLGKQQVGGRTQWWAADGWRRRVRVEKNLGRSRVMGSAFKYSDFLPLQPKATALLLEASQLVEGALAHQYRWRSSGKTSRLLYLDGTTRRPRRLEFFKGSSGNVVRRIDRLGVRSYGINRRAHVWRAVDLSHHRSSTFFIVKYQINATFKREDFTREGFLKSAF